jgi:ABC-type branched-subunit amino acid transport system substrate-binding protein
VVEPIAFLTDCAAAARRAVPILGSGPWGDTLPVGLLIPLQGPAGMFGPSCEASARLAVEEINSSSGVLGRELRLVVIDGGQRPTRVADEVDGLISAGAIDAVIGWHISAVRQAVAPRTVGRVAYVYTALYEGGERTPGVFLAGETPDRQLQPAMRWMREECGVQRWYLVGDDYVWPHVSAAVARSYAEALGGRICAETYVRLGSEDFGDVLRDIERRRPDGILMLLVGEDAVQFNRAFAARGLDERIVRLSPLMDENMLLGTGAGGTRGLYAAAGFFEALSTESSRQFLAEYTRRHGVLAPVPNSLGESCYEGLRLFAELCRRAGSTDVSAICAVAETTGYDGPRGPVQLTDRHLRQRIYLAHADGLDFEVLAQL